MDVEGVVERASFVRRRIRWVRDSGVWCGFVGPDRLGMDRTPASGGGRIDVDSVLVYTVRQCWTVPSGRLAVYGGCP